MLLLKRPSEESIRRFVAAQRDLPFSYRDVGASRADPPAGYDVDHHRVRLGEGEEAFARAVEAARRWEMFHLDWVELCRPDTPIEVGAVVAVVSQQLGFWTLNACRIVYTVNEDGPLRRFGFAYGTLPEHVERGEERFTVEWRRDDDSVWYDVLAFSQPNHPLARLLYPLTRALQKRFANHSQRAMRRAAHRS